MLKCEFLAQAVVALAEEFAMRGVIRKLFAAHLPEILAERELCEREWRGAWCVATCQTAEQGSHACECVHGHGGHERFSRALLGLWGDFVLMTGA